MSFVIFVSDSNGDRRRFARFDISRVFRSPGTVLDVRTQNGREAYRAGNVHRVIHRARGVSQGLNAVSLAYATGSVNVAPSDNDNMHDTSLTEPSA